MEKWFLLIFSVGNVLFFTTVWGLPAPTESEGALGTCTETHKRQDRKTGLCHVILSTREVEGTRELFYNDKDGFGKWDCDYTLFVRHEADNKCYRIAEKGPCKEGEWVLPTSFGKYLTCAHNPCMEQQEEDRGDDVEDDFWFSKDGVCYKTGEKGDCVVDHLKVYKYSGASVKGKKNPVVQNENLVSSVGFVCMADTDGGTGTAKLANNPCGLQGARCAATVTVIETEVE